MKPLLVYREAVLLAETTATSRTRVVYYWVQMTTRISFKFRLLTECGDLKLTLGPALMHSEVIGKTPSIKELSHKLSVPWRKCGRPITNYYQLDGVPLTPGSRSNGGES